MSSVIVNYFKPEMRSAVLRAFKVPSDSFQKKLLLVTSASDEKDGEKIITLHYNPQKMDHLSMDPGPYSQPDIDNLAKLRGIIFDLGTMKAKPSTYGRTVNMIVNKVPLDGLLPVKSGEVPTEGVYKRRYGGALLRTYMIKGKVRPATFKNYDAKNSFFGTSDKFPDIWKTDQDVFSSFDELYNDYTDDVIHVFILNNRKLLVDSRENQTSDHVVYLRSFSSTGPLSKEDDLTNLILEKNKSASKPIILAETYTPEQVNLILAGKSVVSGSESDHFKLFSGGESVIYETNLGMFSLVPSSLAFRQKIMDGKTNVNKLFVDSVADFANNSRGYIDVAFELSDLLKIAEKFQNARDDENNNDVNIQDYVRIEDSPNLQILTNLLFIVPMNLIPDIFNAYNDFEANVLSAIEYIIDRKSDLQSAIAEKRLDKFEGLSQGVKFRDYLIKKLPYAAENRDGPQSNWAASATNLYAELYEKLTTVPDTSSREYYMLCEDLGIISIICDARDELLYSFIIYKNKVTKEREAMAKRAAKA